MRFHLDEHIDAAVAAGLRRRGIDVTTTLEANLQGAVDLAHLAFGHREGRVVVTRDADFTALARSGMEHSGIVFVQGNAASAR